MSRGSMPPRPFAGRMDRKPHATSRLYGGRAACMSSMRHGLRVGGATDAGRAPAGAGAGGKSIVRHKGRGRPGQGLLLEEAWVVEPAVQEAEHADDCGPDGDHERAAALPVDPRHGPHRVVVFGGYVVVQPHAVAAEEE